MEVREIWSPVAKPDTPQCEARRKTPYANDSPGTDKQCKWSARYVIGGQHLCSKHAQKEALRILLARPTRRP